MNKSMSSNGLQTWIKRELKSGETVEWSLLLGSKDRRPGQVGCLFAAIFVICIVVTEFTLWWGTTGLVIMVPAAIVAVVALTFLHFRRSPKDTAYVITNRRAIVFGYMDHRQYRPQVWSFYPAELLRRRVAVRDGGEGEIVFWERERPGIEDPDRVRIGFMFVPDVSTVNSLLQKLIEKTADWHERVKEEPDDVRIGKLGIHDESLFDAVKFAKCAPKRDDWNNPWVLIGLFVVPLAICSSVLPDVGPDILFWCRMRDAVSVTGRLLKVESTGNGQTMGSKVDYSYDIGGHTYIGSRSAIHQGPDNFGDFQQRLFDRLYYAYERKEPVVVYVNPREPSISALDLTLRWPEVSFCVLVVAGALSMTGFLGFRLYRVIRRKNVAATDGARSS